MRREFTIQSKVDGLVLDGLVVEPEEGVQRTALLQLSHGMSEYKERYLPFMEYLAEKGFAAVIHDHRGHGKSVKEKEDLGYTYGGRDKGIVEDLHQVTCWIKEHFPGTPVYMLGHSMGSLAARTYLKEYDGELKKLILTGPPSANPGVDMGLALAGIQKKFRGREIPEQRAAGSAFGPYAAKISRRGYQFGMDLLR